MATGKSKRDSKTSKGTGRGAKRLNPPLTDTQKILMGKGMLINVQKVGSNAYLGATAPSSPVFNRDQVAENRRLYPHLFEEQPRGRRAA